MASMCQVYTYIQKKEDQIHEAISAATMPGANKLYYVCDLFLSWAEMATLLWMLDCHMKGIQIDFVIIRKKAKS